MPNIEIDLIDILLDENNNDNIILYNENGEETEFMQVAIIPIDEKLYVILKPANPIEGLGEDEGLVFTINEDAEEPFLELVVDFEIIDKVFDIYEDLLREQDVM